MNDSSSCQQEPLGMRLDVTGRANNTNAACWVRGTMYGTKV